MEALQQNEQVKKRLAALLAEDRPDAEEFVALLREMRDREGVPTCSTVLHLLAHLSLPEVQAERLLVDLLRHRDEFTRALGRDPGLRVAAIDYLSNVKKLLANPTIVERSLLEKTERSAITDGLTGLFNRRYFMSSLALEVRRSHRYSLRLSLLMLDLDAFKVMNDRHGHLFGDLVLQRVGRVLRRAVRDADLACRFGGEEFAVILPETDRLGAYAVAQRIRRRMEQGFADKPIAGKIVRVRLSGGIASYPQDARDSAGLVDRADQALYLSKSRGKDRISLYHSERRDAIRYPAKAVAKATLRAARGAQPIKAHLLDVSRSGVLLDLREDCSPSAEVELEFGGRDAAGRNKSWVHAGRVVRVERDAASGRPFRLAVAFNKPLPEGCLLQQVQRARVLRAAHGGRA